MLKLIIIVGRVKTYTLVLQCVSAHRSARVLHVLSSAVVCAEFHDRLMFLRSCMKVERVVCSLVCLVFFCRWTEPSSLHVWPISALVTLVCGPWNELITLWQYPVNGMTNFYIGLHCLPIVRAWTNRYKNSFVLYGLCNLQCSAL